jgi:hypothetical protein
MHPFLLMRSQHNHFECQQQLAAERELRHRMTSALDGEINELREQLATEREKVKTLSEQEWTPRKAAIHCWNIRNKSDAKQQFEKIITAALAAAAKRRFDYWQRIAEAHGCVDLTDAFVQLAAERRETKEAHEVVQIRDKQLATERENCKNWEGVALANKRDAENYRDALLAERELAKEKGEKGKKRHHYDAPDGFPCSCGNPIDHPIHIPRIEQ